MRVLATALTFGLLASAAFAQDVTIQPANPAAAANDYRGARVHSRDSRIDANISRRDQHAARVDAAHGNYLGAAEAQGAARSAAVASRVQGNVAHRDAVQGNQQSTTTIRVSP